MPIRRRLENREADVNIGELEPLQGEAFNIEVDTFDVDISYIGNAVATNRNVRVANNLVAPERGRRRYDYGSWMNHLNPATYNTATYDGIGNYRAPDMIEESQAQPTAVERTTEQNFKREYYMYKLSSCFDILSNTTLNANDFTSVDPNYGRQKHSSYIYDYNSDFVSYYRSMNTEEDKSMFMQMILNKYELTLGPDFV